MLLVLLHTTYFLRRSQTSKALPRVIKVSPTPSAARFKSPFACRIVLNLTYTLKAFSAGRFVAINKESVDAVYIRTQDLTVLGVSRLAITYATGRPTALHTTFCCPSSEIVNSISCHLLSRRCFVVCINPFFPIRLSARCPWPTCRRSA